MLKARIKNVGEWKAILNAIGDIVEEAMFIVKDDGITFRGMDPSHVALLEVTFPKSSFEELESKTSFFGIKIEDFKTVMNTASTEDTVELNIKDSTVMRISIIGPLPMEYNLKLIQRQEVNIPLPKTEFKAKLSIEPNTLIRVFSNLRLLSEFVKIRSQSDKIQFFGEGDTGNARIELEKGSPELHVLESVGESSSMYSLEFLGKIIRDIGKASKKINMEYSTENPMHMIFEMPSNIKVDYYLAPRLET